MTEQDLSSGQDNDADSFLQSAEKGKCLSWSKITVRVPDLKGSGKRGMLAAFRRGRDKGDAPLRSVLHDVYGVAKAGEMVAIMGGSGAGKTTLMNQFVNVDQKDIVRSGEIRVNGQVLSARQMRRISAYVQQHDVFVGSLTVREQLTFSATLRMGRHRTALERRERVDQLIHDLNLVDAQHTVIGVPGQVKGISVGEKKRLAFACEVLTDPMILFCDEPTSGLDSFMSEQVVSALRKFTSDNNKTVVVTIHQPSDEVFNMFDKVCFMAMGKVAFFAEPNLVCNFWLAVAPGYEALKKELNLKPSIPDLGADEMELVCPEFHGPAEHSIRMLSQLSDDKYVRERFEKSDIGRKLKQRAEKAEKIAINNLNKDVKEGHNYAANWFVQVHVLFRRSFITTVRDPLLLKVRLFQVVATAIIIGIVNWQTEVTGPTVMNLEGVLYNCPRDMNFMFLFPSIHVITSELPIMRREHRGGIYSVSAYYVAKSLAEIPQYTVLPIIYSTLVYWMSGLVRDWLKFAIFSSMNTLLTWTAISIAYCGACVFGVEDMAQTYMPIMILPMLVFGGFYINFDSIPIYFQWLSFLSWFRYGFEGLQINQWEDYGDIGDCNSQNGSLLVEVNRDNYCPANTGLELLYRRDMHPDNLLLDFGVMVSIMIVARLLGLVAIMIRMSFCK